MNLRFCSKGPQEGTRTWNRMRYISPVEEPLGKTCTFGLNDGAEKQQKHSSQEPRHVAINEGHPILGGLGIAANVMVIMQDPSHKAD